MDLKKLPAFFSRKRSLFLCLILASPAFAAAAPPAAPPSPAEQEYGHQVYAAVARQIAAEAAANAPLIEHEFGPKGATVEVAFIVTPSGQVARDRIMRSSGSKLFDAEVLNWTALMKLPPFPRDVQAKQMTFAVPYFFRGR